MLSNLFIGLSPHHLTQKTLQRSQPNLHTLQAVPTACANPGDDLPASVSSQIPGIAARPAEAIGPTNTLAKLPPGLHPVHCQR